MHTFAQCLFAGMILAGISGAVVTLPADSHTPDPQSERNDPQLVICFEDEDEDTAIEADRIVSGNTAFAFDLYRELARSNEDNIFFSPFSLSTALSMTFAGARGETGEEMANALHLPHWPQETAAKLSPQNRAVHEAFGKLLRNLHAPRTKNNEKNEDETRREPGYEFLLANALWGHRTETFSDDYVSLIDAAYNAPMTLLDFSQAETAAETINSWTDENTGGLIPHLVNPSDVRDASLVLTNAIYFLGGWADEFDPDETRDRPFRVSPDESVTVPMMHQRSQFGHIKYNNATGVVLPYGDGRLSMVALLPDQGHDTEAMIEHLSAEEIERWAHAPRAIVNLAMPKFRMETSSRLVRGEPILPNLGMRRATAAEADLTGIDGGKGGPGRLFISEVIHEAVIEVDEQGTEAAGATGVVVGRTSMPPTVNVTLDRPFIFLIVDHETGSVLFMGRMVNPTV